MGARVRGWAAKGVAAAQRLGVLGLAAVLVPLSSMLTVLATVTVCLGIWRSGPSYTEGLMFPAISELGIDLPQKRVYQAGFAATGALLALGILLFEELVAFMLLPLLNGSSVLIGGLHSMPELNGSRGVCQGPPDAGSGRVSVRLESGEVKAVRPEHLSVAPELAMGDDADLLRSLLRWGYLSAAGVVLQGVFTLERGISAQCFVHWGGAVLFMAGAMQHAKASNELYDAAAKRGVAFLQDRAVAIALRVRHFILDYSSVGLFLAPLLMQALPRSAGSDGKDASGARSAGAEPPKGAQDKAGVDPGVMNAMGLMQWGIILQFAVYFCTYTLDLRAAAGRAASEREKES